MDRRPRKPPIGRSGQVGQEYGDGCIGLRSTRSEPRSSAMATGAARCCSTKWAAASGPT